VQRAAIQQGWVSIFCKHTTAAVVLNENESVTGGGPSIPVAKGKLDLGDRQRVLVLELEEAGAREVVIQVFGA
jgi:thiamine phosphate synthase YjbQ (UPF0047 family)